LAAIDYAAHGFPVTYLNSRIMARSADRLAPFLSGSTIIDGNGKTPKPGSRLKMPQLADSLRKIAADGKETFYRGELAA
jgi:gamma-glutamyltranspeptidase/glutathione hydrolase